MCTLGWMDSLQTGCDGLYFFYLLASLYPDALSGPPLTDSQSGGLYRLFSWVLGGLVGTTPHMVRVFCPRHL